MVRKRRCSFLHKKHKLIIEVGNIIALPEWVKEHKPSFLNLRNNKEKYFSYYTFVLTCKKCNKDFHTLTHMLATWTDFYKLSTWSNDSELKLSGYFVNNYMILEDPDSPLYRAWFSRFMENCPSIKEHFE